VELRARRREITEQEVSQREHLEQEAKAVEQRAMERKVAFERREARRLGITLPPETAPQDGPQATTTDQNQRAIKVPVILKADTDGSMEALRYSVDAMTAELQTKAELAGISGGGEFLVIKRGVGEVTISDIDMAKAFKAQIFAFNVRAPPKVTQMAERSKVKIHTQSVIYHLLDDLKGLVKEYSPTEKVAVVLGSAKVLQIFKMQPRKRSEGTWTVAGCRVTKGKIHKKSRFRILREDKVIFAGGLDSLRIFKDDVNVVEENKECGISFSSFQDFEEGDIIEAFEMEEQVIG
jgi:translation initiation factor IF-2